MKKELIKFVILALVLVSGCSADLATKGLIKNTIKEDSVPVIENFLNFTYVENHAIAFGLFNGVDKKIRMPIIFALPLLATFMGFFLIWRVRKAKFMLLLPLFIIIGGAYGNIVDRAMNGFVTDFLHVHYYFKHSFYVFNVADVLVNIGVFLLLFQYKSFNETVNNAFNSGEVKS